MNTDNKNNLREGFHHVEILINNKPESIKKIYLPLERSDDRIEKLKEKCGDIGLKVEFSKKVKKSPVVEVIESAKQNLKDLKKTLDLNPSTNQTFIVLDNIIDPRNLGAILRTAAVLNIDGIIINKDHCAPTTDTVHRVSCGGSDLLNIFYVSNLLNCIKTLKEFNFEIIGFTEHAKDGLQQIRDGNSALVFGSEEKGIRAKTLEACDIHVNLIKNDKINSLNVSVAMGIAANEVIGIKKSFSK